MGEEISGAVWPSPQGAIHLRASLHETIWGGNRLASIACKPVPEGAKVGESWETALDAVAINAPYEGSALGALVERYGDALIGTRARAVFGLRFPLLAKFIDANSQLSVQVHPNDSYAHAHEGGKLGKTETWYILDAAPGAKLVYGLERRATPAEVRRAIEETRLEELLHSFEVRRGDVVFVPAGTVHAIGAGVVLYELQEYSDVTYRLYDYGRLQANGQPRELHVERGLDVMRFEPAVRDRVRTITLREGPGQQRRVLSACEYFVLEEFSFTGHWRRQTSPASCEILSALDGACMINTDYGNVLLGPGETAVLPAALGAYRLDTSAARVAHSYVPEESDAGLQAWQAAQE